MIVKMLHLCNVHWQISSIVVDFSNALVIL